MDQPVTTVSTTLPRENFGSSNFIGIDEVVTSNSKRIKCLYLKHPNYSNDCTLCVELHAIFIVHASSRSSNIAYGVRRVINQFLDFKKEYNQLNPNLMQLTKLAQVNVEVFNQFQNFLRRNDLYSNRDVAHFKTAIEQGGNQLDLLPHYFLLPSIPGPQLNPSEPIEENAFRELCRSLASHIDYLYKKLEFRKQVDAAIPYDYAEIRSEFIKPECDRPNIFRWYQYCRTPTLNDEGQKRYKYPSKKNLRRLLHASTDEELRVLADDPQFSTKFRKIYESESATYLNRVPQSPFDKKKLQWMVDDTRALKTLIDNGYPFHIPFSVLRKEHSVLAKGKGGTSVLKNCDDIVKLLQFQYSGTKRARSKNEEINKGLRMAELLEHYYPTDMDMAAIVLGVMVNQGWNKEVVLNIDFNGIEHATTGLLNKNSITMRSEKYRSQGKGRPYDKPKEFIAVSDIDDKYSSYNLVRLSDELSKPLQGLEFDEFPRNAAIKEANPHFLCVRHNSVWLHSGRHSSITDQHTFIHGVKAFLTTYPIWENGVRLMNAGDLAFRIRPTVAQQKRKQMPLSILTLFIGHKRGDTTHFFYDSSGAATQMRRARLRSELEAVGELLQQRKFNGLIGKMPNTKQQHSGIKLFFIPGHDRVLWGCQNQFGPDWPGADVRFQAEQKCVPSLNCLFCSQCYIFEESLPYLIDRHVHIQEQLEAAYESDYSSSLNDELRVIDEIIGDWGDNAALEFAFQYQRKHSPIFPRDITTLEIIFDDGDVDG